LTSAAVPVLIVSRQKRKDGHEEVDNLCLIGLTALSVGPQALSAVSESSATAPYLLAGAPTFDMSISEFREKFNADNPKLQLNEFRAIASSRDRANLTRAASKINENLYASTALERGTLKIKSMQITWLPIQGPEQKAAKAKALEYMSAMIRAFVPTLSRAQSQQKLQKLLPPARESVTSPKRKARYAMLSQTTVKRTDLRC
jgi:hypothetical protein